LYSRNKLTLRHKNRVYLYSSKFLKFLLKIQWIFVILLSHFVIGKFRDTSSSVEIRGTWSEKGWEPLFVNCHFSCKTSAGPDVTDGIFFEIRVVWLALKLKCMHNFITNVQAKII